jgi:cytochrome oxidase assembly protein ShyY1
MIDAGPEPDTVDRCLRGATRRSPVGLAGRSGSLGVVYRFLLTPRWLGGAALALAAAVVMVFLGNWQLHRYHERSAINHRIDAADSIAAVPLATVMTAPTTAGTAGPAPGDDLSWTKITMTGHYDPAHEIQARARTVNGDVGFEIVTPLLLTDGTAVLIDRGWVPPGGNGTALAAPTVPPAPGGQVTVIGQIHLTESRPTPIEHRDGRLDTRRISVPKLAKELPYPVYGAYVLLTKQDPANDKAFQPIPIDHEDSWQNAGYTVQWWMFSLMALFAYGWQARKEAETRAEAKSTAPDLGSGSGSGSGEAPGGTAGDAGKQPKPDRRAARSGDRVEEFDRVAEADRRAAEKRAAQASTVPATRNPE